MACKILPHNFVELIDAAISYLRGEDFLLFPDFPTGGSGDFARYNDGIRGSSIKVRAKIEKKDSKTLVITEVPYGKTTATLIESIIKANDKGKIKIRKIDDNTSDKVEIMIHLVPGMSSDKTIDALFAFTDCEVSISPNSCIIEDDKPKFIGVSEILKINTDQTVALLKLELEIRRGELEEAWHFSSLEKIFIEERIYKDKKFEDSANMDEAVAHIDMRLEPWKPKLKREVTKDDILKLMEIRMARILKFNTDKANDHLLAIEAEIEDINYKIENIIPFTIEWFEKLKAKYGKGRERRTEIRNFENIVASKVVIANEKLYVDRVEGFMGTSLKKAEYVCDCSDMDDVIVFRKDGTYLVTKVSEKAFIGKNLLHIAIFKKNDTRTIYNIVYRDGKNGFVFMKRMAVTGVTRDKEYDLTQGTPGSRIMYFSENPNGEAEVLRVTLKPKPRIKKLIFEVDFSELAIKGRSSMGNILTKFEIHKIALKEKGVSTLGGRKIWFDEDVLRLNSDGRGKYLGEFSGDDLILVIYKSGEYLLCNFDLSNHFDDGILLIEKFNPKKVLTSVYFDAEQGFYYVKRFEIEDTQNRKVGFIGEFAENRLISFTWVGHPRLELQFGGKNEGREAEVVDVSEFIGVKSYKAKGKRLSIYEISQINELEPVVIEEVPEEQVEEVKKSDIVIPDIEDLLFGLDKPGENEEPPNQMTLEF